MSDPAKIDAHIGAALRTARLSRGLRQDDLAAQLGLDRSTIARYESGARSMTVDTLMQVAHALNRPVVAFLPDMYTDERLHMVLQVVEQRPDLLARVVELLRVSLADEATDNNDDYEG